VKIQTDKSRKYFGVVRQNFSRDKKRGGSWWSRPECDHCLDTARGHWRAGTRARGAHIYIGRSIITMVQPAESLMGKDLTRRNALVLTGLATFRVIGPLNSTIEAFFQPTTQPTEGDVLYGYKTAGTAKHRVSRCCKT
jgi:hypothetical protein